MLGLPRDLTAAPLERALIRSPEVHELYESILVPLHQRELVLIKRELDESQRKSEACQADLAALTAARQRGGGGGLSQPSVERIRYL